MSIEVCYVFLTFCQSYFYYCNTVCENVIEFCRRRFFRVVEWASGRDRSCAAVVAERSSRPVISTISVDVSERSGSRMSASPAAVCIQHPHCCQGMTVKMLTLPTVWLFNSLSEMSCDCVVVVLCACLLLFVFFEAEKIYKQIIKLISSFGQKRRLGIVAICHYIQMLLTATKFRFL